MNNIQYDVVVTGELLDGATRESAIAGLQELFKMSAATATSLLAGRPVTVKKAVDRETAARYIAQLRTVGVRAVPRPMQATGSLPSSVGSSLTANAASSAVAGAPRGPAPEPPSAAPPLAESQTPTAAGKAAASFPGLHYSIEGEPDFAFLNVSVPAGQTLMVEASAMATMDTHLRMKTKLRGGLGRLVTGESLFINEFTADGAPAQIGIAPGAPGDLRHVYLKDEIIYLQSSGYVASTPGVTVETKWQGLTKGFFSGENLFLVRCLGQGDLWFNSYGGIIEIDVRGDYVVDTGNVVAFTGGLEYRMSKVGSYKSLFFSGEGLVCRFSGEGRLWVQTRKLGALTHWVRPFRRVAKRG